MTAILKKELRAYFLSPIGYTFIGIFFFLSSLIFAYSNILVLNANLKPLFGDMTTAVMFIIPILTMRLLSEEKNHKTDQLLLTSRVSVTEIVIGKILSAFIVFALFIALTLIYPIIISFYGTISIPLLISQYFGFLLMGLAFISIGTYISSLTENQLISAIATLGALFLLFILDKVSPYIKNELIVKIINFISIQKRYEDFAAGFITVKSVVFYLSVAGMFGFLTVIGIDKNRRV